MNIPEIAYFCYIWNMDIRCFYNSNRKDLSLLHKILSWVLVIISTPNFVQAQTIDSRLFTNIPHNLVAKYFVTDSILPVSEFSKKSGRKRFLDHFDHRSRSNKRHLSVTPGYEPYFKRQGLDSLKFECEILTLNNDHSLTWTGYKSVRNWKNIGDTLLIMYKVPVNPTSKDTSGPEKLDSTLYYILDAGPKLFILSQYHLQKKKEDFPKYQEILVFFPRSLSYEKGINDLSEYYIVPSVIKILERRGWNGMIYWEKK